ncbi:hypothetical protein M885DRAFT_291175 [Pelagophyceae sp. CCMP2097]|nr:hypothetical protein M885DRAFT_291175 [Pelagophyceae sp. CCMP2097]
MVACAQRRLTFARVFDYRSVRTGLAAPLRVSGVGCGTGVRCGAGVGCAAGAFDDVADVLDVEAAERSEAEPRHSVVPRRLHTAAERQPRAPDVLNLDGGDVPAHNRLVAGQARVGGDEAVEERVEQLDVLRRGVQGKVQDAGLVDLFNGTLLNRRHLGSAAKPILSLQLA